MSKYTLEAYDDLLESIATCEGSLKEARLRMGISGQADWHDNAAFDQASDEVRSLIAQLSRLTAIRNQAEIVKASGSEIVDIGSTVIVKYADNETETIVVDGRATQSTTNRVNEVMRVSTASPLGAALLGRRAGDSVKYLVPSGNEVVLSVIEVA